MSVAVYDGGRVLAKADANAAAGTGRWRVNLEPLPAGGRYSLLVDARGPEPQREEMRLFSNVLVGEVWLICGQSNAQFHTAACAEYDDILKHRLEYPLIRVALIGRRMPETHTITETQEDVHGFFGPAKWEEASWTVTRDSGKDIPGNSSAVSYLFARDLSRYLGPNVPVGMLEVTQILPVEAWVDETLAAEVPELKHLLGRGYPSATGRSFKANIAPLAPYAMRGAIYYQGEMNGSRPADYYYGLRTLIRSWRRAWERPELPFLIVQLPGYMGSGDGRHPRSELDMPAEQLAVFDGRNAGHDYCYIREAQLRVSRELSGVGLTVIIDKGEKFDIHPPRKGPVGDRLALKARQMVYGDKTLVGKSPIPREFRREGDRYVISFDGVGSGLVAAKGGLKSFEVRDAEGAWHPGEAAIKGATVEVRSAKVKEPSGVRYAWFGFTDITLYNKEGLPATPFQHPPVDLKAQQEQRRSELDRKRK